MPISQRERSLAQSNPFGGKLEGVVDALIASGDGDVAAELTNVLAQATGEPIVGDLRRVSGNDFSMLKLNVELSAGRLPADKAKDLLGIFAIIQQETVRDLSH